MRRLLAPGVIASALLAGGFGCAVAGVYLLAGLGWSLLAAALPMAGLGAALIRGILRVG